jgi:hypothetical protein
MDQAIRKVERDRALRFEQALFQFRPQYAPLRDYFSPPRCKTKKLSGASSTQVA